jgi:tetratricopeptide (TPR) repeat protein
MPGPMFLMGKVALEGGSAITDTVVIQSICHGNVSNEAYSDSKGTFSLNLGDRSRNAVASADEAESTLGNPGGSLRPRGPRDLRDCALQAFLPGFHSDVVQLRGKGLDQGYADVGTIMLHRMAHVEGFTVSATTAAAPPAARKEYEKGKEDEQKAKWESAANRFAKAVEIYPRYAAAWCELGRVQLQRNDEPAARTSFGRAQEADSKFITPYAELAKLALKAKDWKELRQVTETLLALDPVEYPQRWYYNAAANYYLDDLDKAEKSAARCIALDEQHRIPRIEYLLGMVLAKKKDYSGAAAHIKNYIRLVPGAPDLEAARQQIAELEMSAAALSQKPE